MKRIMIERIKAQIALHGYARARLTPDEVKTIETDNKYRAIESHGQTWRNRDDGKRWVTIRNW